MPTLFFQLANDRGRADLQHPSCVSDTTTIESHLDDLRFDFWYMPLISRVADKGIVGAIRVVTAIALFAGLGGSALDHLITLTMRAQHGNENHDILLVKKLDIMAHIGLKSPLLKHDPEDHNRLTRFCGN